MIPGKTIMPLPTAVLLVEMVAMLVLAQVTVMAAGLGGVWVRLTVVETCRFVPVVTCVVAPRGGAVTVAVICRLEAGVGVEKFAGVPIDRLVAPAAKGVKVAVALVEPPEKVNGEVTVPIWVAELANGTVTVPIAGFNVP